MEGFWNVPHVVLQFGPPERAGVEVPVLPVLVSLVTLIVLAGVVAAAFLRPRPTARVRSRRKRPDPVVAAPVEAPSEPVLKKAPVAIRFPAIREGFPDVWGVSEPLEVVLTLLDKRLAAAGQPKGLVVRVGGHEVETAFRAGAATLRREFSTVGPQSIVVDYTPAASQVPKRTRRTLRIVDYRMEMAEVFHKFKEESSRVIAPIRDDATPWEVLDILTEAKPQLPEATLRRIIQGFEEAKYSNHPVDRSSYEKMIEALLQLERVEL